MEQDKKHRKKSTFFKRLKYFLTPQSILDARMLDYVHDHPELSSGPPHDGPPAGEFEIIMAKMKDRGMKPAIRRELRFLELINQFTHFVRKPVTVSLMVLIILGGTSVGVSAKKAYDYRVRERVAGKSNIVWNNDEYVLTEADGLEKAYSEIEKHLEIKSLKMGYVPFELKFIKTNIENGNATIEFDYENKKVYFIQAKYPITASNSVVSDRNKQTEVYNNSLKKSLAVERNVLNGEESEFSVVITYAGAYYHLSGIMEETEFLEMVKYLEF